MRTLMPVTTAGSRTPIFCVNGEPLKFAKHLPHDQPLFGLSDAYHPNFQAPEKIQDLAAMYVREIQLVQPHGPYRIIGFSIGGLIAFEVARQLLQKNEQMDYLALIDPSSPAIAYPNKGWVTDRMNWATETIFRSGKPLRGIRIVLKHAFTSTTVRTKTRLQKIKIAIYQLLGIDLPIELRRARSEKAINFSVRGFQYSPIDAAGSVYTISRPEHGAEATEEFWAGAFKKGGRVHWVDSVNTHMEFMEDENIAYVVREIVREIDEHSTPATST